MKRLLAVLAVLLLGTSWSIASDCVRSRVVYQTYQPTTVVATPFYQYTAPTYATNYAYQQVVLVPQIIPVESYASHSYSIDQGYRDYVLLQAVKQAVAEATGGRGNQQQPEPVQQPQYQSPQRQSPPIPPGAQTSPQVLPGPSRPATGIDRNSPSAFQDANLIGIINAKCVKCHQQQNKITLLTDDGKQLANLTKKQALTVYWMVNTGVMPKTTGPVKLDKDGKPIPEVPDEYMPLFAKWVEASPDK